MGIRGKFDEAKHLRGKKGGGHGGEFVSKGDTGGAVAAKAAPDAPVRTPSANPVKRYSAAKVSQGAALKGKAPKRAALPAKQAATRTSTPKKAPATKAPATKAPGTAPKAKKNPHAVGEGQVPVSQFGMHYSPGNEMVVHNARQLPESHWDDVPVQTLPHGTKLQANEAGVTKRHIDKVVSGAEPFREGYHAQLLKTKNGDLHVVDGHTRVAMYHSLGKDMPVKVIDEHGNHAPLDSAPPPPTVPPGKVVQKTTSHGDISIVNGVAVLSTPEDFEDPANVSSRLDDAKRAEARARATEIFLRATKNAPEVQAAIRNAVKGGGGKMGREVDDHTGAPTVVKTEHSTWRKVQGKMAKDDTLQASDIHLNDSVRFTSVFGEDDYSEGVQRLTEAVTKLGYTLKQPPPDINDGKGGWALGAYRGLNMTFERNGFEFELQVHTQKSLDVATINHPLYDIARSDDGQVTKLMADTGPKGAHAKTGIDPDHLSPGEYKQAIDDKMFAYAEHAPFPKGVAVLGEKDSWANILHVPESSTFVAAAPERQGQRIAGPTGAAPPSTTHLLSP